MVRCHAHHAALVHVAGAAHAALLMVLLTALAAVVTVVVLLLLLLLMVVVAAAATVVVLMVVLLMVVVVAAEVAVVVLLAERVANVQLALLEHQLLLFDAQHFGCVVLALIGNEAVAFRVATRVRNDARILDGAKVSKVVSQLVLRGRLWNTAHEDAIRYSKHVVVVTAVVVIHLIVHGRLMDFWY